MPASKRLKPNRDPDQKDIDRVAAMLLAQRFRDPMVDYQAFYLVTKLLDLLFLSKPRWDAGEKNDEIALEVSLSAKKIRAHADGGLWCPMSDYNYDKEPRLTNHRPYLGDIGDYLCGIQRWGDAFDVYALILEYIYTEDVDMITLLSCVRSAHNRNACRWISWFLRKNDVVQNTTPANRDTVGLVHLVLAKRFSRHGLSADAREHMMMAIQLREQASSSLSDSSSETHESLWISVQDAYFLDVGRKFDVTKDTAAPTGMADPEGNATKPYSQLTMELNLLWSKLISFSKVIQERISETVADWEVGRGEEPNAGTVDLSIVFFKILWHTHLNRSRDLWPVSAETDVGVSTVRERLCLSLPDFAGTCCDMLAQKVIRTFVQARGIRTLPTLRDYLRDIDLVKLVFRMDIPELHSLFVDCYCNRNSNSGSRSSEVMLTDPLASTLAPSCTSSDLSYQGMKEARAAMARDRPTSSGGLPSRSREIDQLSVSMESVGLDDM
ncbi:hypothetical protein PG991_003069 [Apiospora marii]|uniref:Uncharacterized protein n=2 Tax=Apiospora marii TaxID=335849 RepID=A0ABR1SH59_9PEZI